MLKKILLILLLLLLPIFVMGATKVFPYQGGTGQDTSAWDGFVKVISGVWSTSTIDISNDTNLATSTGISLIDDTIGLILGEIDHDLLLNFVSNEHLDWTQDLGATNIHSGNYTDTNTTYSATGTLLDLTGTDFSVNEGTLTDTKLCLYSSGTGLVCNTTDSSSNWDTAYTDRLKWNGGSTGLTAATGRTSLGLGTMALEANTGATTITTVGTIGTGVWQGTAIGNTWIASSTEFLVDNDTTYTGGTNLTLVDTTFNVDDSFIKLTGDTTGALSEDLNIDDDTLVVKYDTNKVAIGTTTAFAKLHVVADSAGFDTSWYEAGWDGIAVSEEDPIVRIIGSDGGTYGARLDFIQMDESNATDFENAWNIVRQTNGDGDGDGSLLFNYGTSVGGASNPNVVKMYSNGDFAVDGTTFYVDDSTDRVCIGSSSCSYKLSLTGDDTLIQATRINDFAGAGFYARRARAGTTDIQNNDNLFKMLGYGYIGGAYRDMAQILLEADVVSTTSHASRITFRTVHFDSTSTPVERMRIDPDGDVGIGRTDPLADLHVKQDVQIGTDAHNQDTDLSIWAENGYEATLRLVEDDHYGMGLRYNADANVIYFDRYNNTTTPDVVFYYERDDGDIFFDTNTLSIKTANNRVGIQTVDPQATLHVNGGDTIFQVGTADGSTDSNINFGWNGYGFYWKYVGTGSGNDNELELWSEGAGGADVMAYEIEQDGQVMFPQNAGFGGVTAPLQAIQLDGALRLTNSGQSFMPITSMGGIVLILDDNANDDNDFHIVRADEDISSVDITNAVISASTTKLFTIDQSTGFVGINDETPFAHLDVDGEIRGKSHNFTTLKPALYNGHAGVSFTNNANNEGVVLSGYNHASSTIFRVVAKPYAADPKASWDPTSYTRLTQLASGNLGIMTATPEYRLHVNGDAKITDAVILEGALTLNTAWTGLLRADSGVVSTTTAGAGDLLADGSVPMTADFNLDGNNIDNGGVIFLKEQADADADIAGQGQIWVNTATPNELWWTDDAGTDVQLGTAGAGDITDVFDCASGDCNTMTVGTSEYLAYGTGYIDANRFAGVTTVDATEFGYLNGVTSAIQTQFDAKQGTLTNSAGLLAALSDETGTGLAVFSTSPTFTTGITVPANSISASELNEGDNFTWTGTTHSFSGVTNLTIPGVADAASEIAIDTTDDDQFIYYGDEANVVVAYHEKCFTDTAATTTHDNIGLWAPHRAIEVTDMYCWVDAATSTEIIISDGTNALDTMTCTVAGASDDGTIANSTFTANEKMEYDTGTIVGSPTRVTFCLTYKITAD